VPANPRSLAAIFENKDTRGASVAVGRSRRRGNPGDSKHIGARVGNQVQVGANRSMRETSSMLAVTQAEWLAVRTMAGLRALVGRLPPPVVMFNKSHSGSRLLATLMREAGLQIGAVRNESEDALPLLDLVEHCVETFYPDYAPVFAEGSAADRLAEVAARALAAHLAGHDGGPWGWKLSETGYILPILAHIFPHVRAIHLIRDGRDVAFANHVAPSKLFWQKIYANSADVGRWNGLFFGRHARGTYRLYPHLYNIQHWANAVTVGRRSGFMLGARYCETRYETLCGSFEDEARRLLAFAGLGDESATIARLRGEVSMARIGRFRREPFWKVRQVTARARPLLAELGYLG